jgi:serine/threonine protein kinase
MPSFPEPHTASGRRPRATRDPLIGTMIDDRFFIEARIATGGFGAIYRARTSDGEPVALKILHPRLTADPNMVARFRREGATLTQLHDPNTVTTLAVGETHDGTLYIAMELLTGESLHERLGRDGALPWQTAVAIARAVCSSLAEAHALGVVHRDLKPENIHVEARDDGPDAVKVIDFGIVKIERGSAIDDGHELTYAGHMIGTYEYMSPEQIVGSPCRDLSDIYSLGLVLYEMLTGRRPFPHVTGPASMMTALLTQTPAPPSLLAGLPPALDHIVMRCLEREPQDRFADIRELAAALDRVLACSLHEEVTAVRPAYDPSGDDRLGSAPPREAAGAVPGEEERTWIDLESRTIPDEPPWAMPRIDVLGATLAAIPVHRIATGTGPVLRTPPASLYTTLPGIAVATRRGAEDRRAVPPEPPPVYAIAPVGWPLQPQAATWFPPPTIPCEPLAITAGPPLPARSYGVLWVALGMLCAAAIALAAAI